MHYVLKISCTLFFIGILNTAKAQSTKTAVKGVLSADSLASGNLKDVLTSFFQLSYNKLTGPNKELNFSSNPYALLLKTNPSAAIDVNYEKYKYLRKLNFGFGLKLDTAYHFNGFSSVIKYALIDERDATVSKMLFRELGNDSLSLEINALQTKLNAFINTTFPNTVENFDNRKKYFTLVTTLFTDTLVAFNQLDTSFQRMVKTVAVQNDLLRFSRLIQSNPKANVRKESQLAFAELKQELKKKLLWTVSLSDTTYKNEFFFSNIVLKTELLKGLAKKLKPGSNWELNTQASLNFIDDTSRMGRDLKRSVFSFEPGFNWVVRTKDFETPFLEFKFSGEYRHIFNRLYTNEERDAFTFNGTIRLRILNEIWIPIEFKYDPKAGNILGFISAKFNFSSLNKVK
jgi:hypothetical protein